MLISTKQRYKIETEKKKKSEKEHCDNGEYRNMNGKKMEEKKCTHFREQMKTMY